MKKYAKSAAAGLLRTLVRYPVGRKTVAFLLRETQYALGVGSGADTDSSGEDFLFKLLREQHPEAHPLRIFDVGANHGQFLGLALRELEGRDMEVHSFEPSPVSFALLKKVAPVSPKVILNHCGLGKEEGTFQLFSNGPGSPFASLTKRDLSHFNMQFDHAEEVKITTLDHYCAAQRVGYIDLLKIDVEGHDLDVLQGGRSLLSSGKVGLVTFEFGGGNIDTRTFVRDFHKLFLECSMPFFYRILPGGGLLRITEYSESLEVFLNSNFLASRLDLRQGSTCPQEVTSPHR